MTYADLEPATQEGARQLSQRIYAAARRVCAGSRLGLEIDRVALYKACVADSYRDATARVSASQPSGAYVVQVHPVPPRTVGARDD